MPLLWLRLRLCIVLRILIYLHKYDTKILYYSYITKTIKVDTITGKVFLWIFVVLLNYAILSNFGLRVLKILQLNEYSISKTFKHFLKTYFLKAGIIAIGTFSILFIFTYSLQANNCSLEYSYILLSVYMFALFFCSLDSEVVLPKFTKRLTRLFTLTSLLFLIGFSIGCIYLNSHPIWLYPFVTLMPLIGYLLIYFSHLCLLPIERGIKAYYICRTKKKLSERSEDMLVIGITGSFGKTSTKNFLDVILSEKYVVLSTPQNYNTPMGISRTVINSMTINQEIFIVEMGAYKNGDIGELCRIAKPKIGVLTSIGGQHLNTFKTLENVYKTKNELISSLPDNGIAFFNLDNELCEKAFDECKFTKIGVYTHSAVKETKRRDENIFVAKKMQMTEEGMEFSVNLEGEDVDFSVKVLGRHNVTNILLAIAVAKKLELTNIQIRRGVARIRAVPHRLELKHLPSGDLLIDDAYNSNVIGFKNALQVLKEYNRHRVVVTPGIIDLGKSSEEVNAEIGREIAGVADEVVIVKESNKSAITKGLLAAGFDKKHIYYANSFKEAQKKYREFLNGKSIVLLENDLPENYI